MSYKKPDHTGRATTILTQGGVILDEFQEIERLGSEGSGAKGLSAMRMVRATIQHQQHVTYVFAGSDRQLIEKLHNPQDGALYNLGRRFEIGPIPPDLLSEWLEDEFAGMGIDARGMGAHIIVIAGDRTRDVRTLAETAADLAWSSEVVNEALLTNAMETVVRQRRPMYESDWKRLTALQQNVLRAVSVAGRGLTTRETLKRYTLGDTSRVTKTLNALEDQDIVLRDGDRYIFDDPFFRAWVIASTLPDVGIHLPVTHVAP